MTPEVAKRLAEYVAMNRMRLASLHPGTPVSTEELAKELASDAHFAKIGLCKFWRDPTVEEVRAVLTAIPDPYGVGPPVELLATAVTLACSKHTRGPRGVSIAAGTVGTLVLGWLISRASGGRDG